MSGVRFLSAVLVLILAGISPPVHAAPVEFELTLDQGYQDYSYESPGTLLYEGLPFDPPVLLNPGQDTAVLISIPERPGTAAAISLDLDGKNKIFLLELEGRTSVQSEAGVQRIFWSPSRNYLFAILGGDYQRFLSIHLGTKRMATLDLTRGDRDWGMKGEPQWKNGSDTLVFLMEERCSPFAEAPCGSYQPGDLVREDEVQLDVATLRLSRVPAAVAPSSPVESFSEEKHLTQSIHSLPFDIGLWRIYWDEYWLWIVLVGVPVLFGLVSMLFHRHGYGAAMDRMAAWLAARRVTLRAGGFFKRWVLRPPVAIVLELFGWTETLSPPALKTGFRSAFLILTLQVWLIAIFYAVVAILIIIAIIAAIAFAVMILNSLGEKTEKSSDWKEDAVSNRQKQSSRDLLYKAAAGRGRKLYSGTGWGGGGAGNVKGRVDEDGNIYESKGLGREERVGRVDEAGNVYRATGWVSEERVGKVDSDNVIHEQRTSLIDDQIGRVKDDGSVQEDKGWLGGEDRGKVDA